MFANGARSAAEARVAGHPNGAPVATTEPAGPEAGTAELRVAGRVIKLEAPAGTEISVGRYAEDTGYRPDIDLGDLPSGRTVSRRHARLYQRDDEWFIRVEPAPHNPTRVDGHVVEPGRECPLDDGQQLLLGSLALTFHQQSTIPLVGPEQIELRLEPASVTVEPGSAVTATITVTNYTDHVDQFLVELRRLPDSWYTIALPSGVVAQRFAEVSLFQTQARIAPASDAVARLQVVFNPPRDCWSTAGVHRFTIRVTTRAQPRVRREIDGTLTVTPFDGLTLSQASSKTRRLKSTFAWRVRNTGNHDTEVNLSAHAGEVTGAGMFARAPEQIRTDSTDEEESGLRFLWEKPVLHIGAGITRPAELRVGIRRRHWWGDPLVYHFAVAATAMNAMATEGAQVICPPRVAPWIQNFARWLWDRLPFLALLAGALFLLWTFFQPPEISFQAAPDDMIEGQPVTFTWTVKHATFYTIDGSNFQGQRIRFLDQLQDTSGTYDEIPAQTTHYILRAQNAIGLTSTDDQTVIVHALPHIESLTVNPTNIAEDGAPVQVSWRVIEPPDEQPADVLVTASGPAPGENPRTLFQGNGGSELVDHPTQHETHYEVVLSQQGETIQTESSIVTMTPPLIQTLLATPPTVVQGGNVRIRWMASGYSQVSIRKGADENDDSQPEIPLDASAVEYTDQPDADTWYAVTVSNGSGSETRQIMVSVTPPPPAATRIDFFTASPPVVDQGQAATLTYSEQNADQVTIRDSSGRTLLQDNPAGQANVLKSVTVAPDTSSVYALTASNDAGEVTQAVTVDVRPPPPTPAPTPEPTPAPPPPDVPPPSDAPPAS